MPNQANIERFNGFAALYDASRPAPPRVVLETILSYAVDRPSLAADVGCGTGLSTFPWARYAARVVGIEPNLDFLGFARAKAKGKRNIEFREGHSAATGLPDASADIVTCSQAFHWMEPAPTLKEFARLLKPGGVLAVFDCQWPLVMGRELEMLHTALIDRANAIYAAENKGEAVAYQEKAKHPTVIAAAGVFSYTREILLHTAKRLTADAIIGTAVSQGAVQTALRRWPDAIRADVEAYKKNVRTLVRVKRRVIYSYNLVIGIKGDEN